MTTSTGDPAMDIEERLDALQRSFKHEIASLMAKNEELEVKNLEADIRITELQVLVERNAAKTNGDDWISMNTNAYTFLYTSATCSGPFIAGLVTCVMQYAVFSLFLLDLLNTTSIPPGVAALVRVCQIIAIIISFLVETDMLSALRAVFYREGFEEMKAAFDGFSPWKFFFANFLMGMQGMLGKVVAFFLIIFSDNVFDLLLNFTAVMFVSEVDEIVLLLCKAGFVGRNAEKMAKKIQEMKLPQGSPKGIVRHAHLVLYGLTVLAVFIIFAIIAREQDSQNSLAAFVKVQFGDEVDPTLGLFSGCYGKELNVGWDARVRYVQTKSDRGQGNFEYCLDDDLQTWVFANVEAETACNDNFELRSAEERSTSFDLLDAKGDQWLLGTGNPISGFQLGEIDPSRFEIECGNIAINGIVASKTEELCPVLTIDAEAIGFSGSHDWSRTFEMAENRDTEVVQFYQRPVFIGDSPGTEGYEILFFAGRRWVLASATKLLAAGDDPFNRTNVVSLFETSNFWLLELPAGALSYLSEDVDQGNDRGTPLGLQWYNARYAEGVGFPFADISRPVDASFRCGKCNGVTNPCLYDGICLDDGTCDCSHGASGKLCEIKPLGDGACNPFFNTAPDEYDGGDCCMASCSQPNCGVGAMNFAFGESLLRNGTGFAHCADPSMVPIIILLSTEIGVAQVDTFFESYTVEVLCEEGAKASLRVGLDPFTAGLRNETLYLEDKTGSCMLSFIGMQSWSGLQISYQIMDGLHSSASSMLMMSEARSITTDGIFPLPAVYSRCLKDTLDGVINHDHLYTGSYQDEAFAWLSNEIPVNYECRNEDYLIERYALVAVSTAEEAPESWISSRDHCLWSRVTCDGSRVVEFTYDGGTSGMLQGTLASEITHLRHLERLEVFVNNFTEGTIPSEISELTALTALIFQVNRRTGTIPSEMFQLTALQELTMAGNFLSGTVPTEVGLLSALTTLTLFGNAFSGSIPSEVGKLSKLQTFDLSNNALSGSLPLEVGYLSALTVLNIFNNTDLWGSMPTEIGNLSALTRLELNSNALSGTIPSEVGELSALTDLFLHNNAMAGTMPSEVGNLSALVSLDLGVNALSGTLPSEVGQLMSLTILLLNNNALSGTVPLELGNLGALTSLFLNSNALSGTVPSEFSNMRSLKSIDLTNNSLSGTIPSEVSILSGLTLVSMANNVLSGTIPLEIGSLFALTAVYLNNNALNGTVPSEIGNLRALTKLSLYSNRLSGTIPSQIGYLSALTTLWLYDNTLSGIIPSEVGNLSVLAELDIDSNAISGSLPSEVGNISTLTWLSVPGNGLSGSLPTEVGNLGALTTLYLHNNALTGTIPSDVGNLTSLVQLSLFTNALSGAIPLEIGNLSALGLLTVSGNAMSGAIPSEIGSLSALAILNLQDNVFSGSLPSEVGSLSALGWLYLSGNAFFGNIPSEVGNLSGLSSLWLFNNALSGTIPSEIGKLTSLTELYLNSNALSGSLPSEVGNLSSLSWLYLYGNAISGSLPSEIGKLSSLISLWLYNSALSGTIPSEIGSSKAMASLQLNDNAFSGTLPVEVGKLSGLRDLYLHNNAISGSIPSEVGNLNAVTTLHLYNNALSGSIPSEIGNLSSLGALGLHGNALVGALPTEIGLLNGLVYLNVRDNNLDETLPSEIGLLTNLQYLIADGNQLSGPLPTEILQLTNLIHLELSGNRFNEDLSFYPCEETIVEMTLTTDLYPSSTAWIVTTAENGSVVASGDGYSFASFAHKLMLCIPSDGCNFTVFDQYYQDGGPTVEITRLGKLYQIDGALFTDNKVDVDICA